MTEASGKVGVAAIQMTSGASVEANLEAASELVQDARRLGASLLVLPENFAFMGHSDADRVAVAEADKKGPIQDWLSETARDRGLWIVAGTVPVKADGDRCFSACLLFGPDGERRARYDKIHLFDVTIPGKDENYRESEKTLAGQSVVVSDSPLGRLGLAVCYDLRFPEQFRRMLSRGMQALAIPAAFTRPTGAAHWELLVRARAVENLCPVIAAAQGGRHESGRETWGHSMIVDAWGTVQAECAESPGVAFATLDLDEARRLRQTFPALDHRQL